MNEYLLDYIGKTSTEKILEDARKYILENKVKTLKFNPRPNVVSFVYTKDQNQIMQIGASIPNDLLTNNFGKLLAQMFRNVSTTGQELISLTDTGGTIRSNSPYWFADVNFGNGDWRGMLVQVKGSIFSGIQIGQGITEAARSDFKIESPFTNGGPEDSKFTIQVPVFNIALSRCSFSNSIISVGSGGISETVLLNRYCDRSQIVREYCIARDNINPVVSFTPGQSIFTEYIFQF